MEARRTRLRGLSVLIVVQPLGCAAIVGADFDEKSLSGGSCPASDAPAVSIAAGHQHTCAITSSDEVLCWGSNADGQLGIGAADTMPHPEPTAAPCLSNVVQVAAGKSHTCALIVTTGDVFCWGGNNRGQLGTGDMKSYHSPRKVEFDPPGPALEIVAGDEFTCARMEIGNTVFCWGANDHKQLGGEVSDGAWPTPTGIVSLIGSTWLAAGSEHACAIHKAGELACWGNNANGQAGRDPKIMSDVPVPTAVVIEGNPSGLVPAVGAKHSCALADNGTVYCWGSNSKGQLGTDGAPSDSYTPTSVSLLTETLPPSISLGGMHSCAIQKGEKNVFCWGENASGQLGTGDFDTQSAPTVVPLSKDWGPKALALGYAHTCLLTDYAVKCWGDNAAGQLGVSPLKPSATPVDALTW